MRLVDLDGRTLTEALRLLGERGAPGNRVAAARRLRERLGDHRAVRDVLEDAPDAAREAFVRLATEGPASVDDLLGRGWAGRGTLPAPLDWLQHRALVAPGPDGLVHAVAEPQRAFMTPTLELAPAEDPAPPELAPPEARVLSARGVVVADAAVIDALVADDDLDLEAVADTVAVGDVHPERLRSALRRRRVRLLDEEAVDAQPAEPALPSSPERAVGPKAIRALLGRAVEEHRQVWLRYFTSSRGGASTERVVDPWGLGDDLLRGWCHLRRDERVFAVGRIGEAVMLPDPIGRPDPGASA